MTTPTVSRATHSFADRASALALFFQRAGEAPRLLAYDDELGCPLHSALSSLEWTLTVGILADTDMIHAARLGGEYAAEPYEGSLLYDEPGVRAFEFAQRAHAVAHFLRATQGVGGVVSMLSRRAPELLHVRRWLAAVFEEPPADLSNLMLAGWFATTGGGVLFTPGASGKPYVYQEVGVRS
jgi:hypothetical protein